MIWIKKHRGLVIFLALILVFLGWRWQRSQFDPEQQTKRYFYHHMAELEEDIARWQTEGRLSFQPTPGLMVNVWDSEHDIVEYIVVSRGNVPSSTYYGFFYSPDKVPVSFQNSGEALIQRDQYEWDWRGEGDNHGYVELMQPYWYYFEASL